MTRLSISAAATVCAGLALAACGGASNNGGATSATAAASGSRPVAARLLTGVGRILVDANGNALYTNDQEHGSANLCTDACTAFWKPLRSAAGGKSPATPDGRSLGVLTRPDGTMQLAVNAKPLYTFSEDSPGTAKGNNFTDDFSSHHFTWHVVRLAGATTNGPRGVANSNAGSGGSSYPNNNYSGY